MLRPSKSLAASAMVVMILLPLLAACGDSGTGPPADQTIPSVISNTPVNGTNAVPLNGPITATFSEPMDPSTLTNLTFIVASGSPLVLVPGTVTYEGTTATFVPYNYLDGNKTFYVRISTEAESAEGVKLTENHDWSFSTVNSNSATVSVDLGQAQGFAILAKSGISSVPISEVTGDVGIGPAAASNITGFALTMDQTNQFSIAAQITGEVYAADYANPTPAWLTAAVGDMEIAFTDAAARAPAYTELGAGNVGGMTLAPGVYKWGTGLLVPTNVTLSGSATDVWIFQIAEDLTVSEAVHIILTGGALERNVFWQVSGSVSIGTTAHVAGVILSQTSISLQTGATVIGRLHAQTAVTMDRSVVVEPVE